MKFLGIKTSWWCQEKKSSFCLTKKALKLKEKHIHPDIYLSAQKREEFKLTHFKLLSFCAELHKKSIKIRITSDAEKREENNN